MNKQVVLYKKIPGDQLARLEQHFHVTCFDGVNDANREAFLAAVSTAHGLIGASIPIRADVVSRAAQLEAISTISVGYDQFDVADLSARGIALMHTPGVLTETTADTIFTLILTTARRAVELAAWVKAGHWQRSIGESLYGVNVHHKTIGIIGMGRIGMALGRRAHCGFGMNVLYYNNVANPQAERELGARQVSLDELLANSDFVCVVLPLSPETEKFIGAEQFAKMRPDAIFINGSRGKIVDEAALIEALQQGRIRGAGLDVFEVEPLPASSPLLRLSNVVALPHIGSATHETRHAMVVCAVDNLIAALAGKVKENCVNPQVLAARPEVVV